MMFLGRLKVVSPGAETSKKAETGEIYQESSSVTGTGVLCANRRALKPLWHNWESCTQCVECKRGMGNDAAYSINGQELAMEFGCQSISDRKTRERIKKIPKTSKKRG